MANVTITEKPIFDLLKVKQSDIIKFMGGEDNFKKEVSFAIQAANSNEMLAQADPKSVAKAVYNVGITGLSLNPVKKLAYLVPKRINGVWEAVLFPSYQGLVKLITDAGMVKKIDAQVVYDGDDFEYEQGIAPKLVHRPKGKSRDIVAVYAVAHLEGDVQVEVMWKHEVDEIMQRSDSGKKNMGPWKTDYPEMARKTVLRRIFKYLPKSDKFDKVAEAIALDEQDYPATIGQVGYIETLLRTSAIEHEERARIERQLDDITSMEAERLIARLQDNQLDPIHAGLNYNTGDINRRISQDTMDDAERADNQEQLENQPK